MKSIPFTDEQFEALLKLTYMGDWLVSAHREAPEGIEKFDDIAKYILSHAKNYGLADLVIEDEDGVYPSAQLEDDEEVRDCIDDYNDATFWDELSNQLAVRAAIKIHGEEKFESMSPMERVSIISDLEDYYMSRFSVEGLDRLHFFEENVPDL